MFVDASALVAVLLKEADAQVYSAAMEAAERTLTSPIAIYEAVCAIMRERKYSRRDAQSRVEEALATAGMQIVPISQEIGIRALGAFEMYGKGRGHRARLNMGDCFAYACAKSLGVPLLYKGDDFVHTDLA